MTDAIEFYLTIFKEISSMYEDKFESHKEVFISEKLYELMKKLKQENDSKAVEDALAFVLKTFENYYSDDYNRVEINISDEDRNFLSSTLEKELFAEDNDISKALKNLSVEERKILLDTLKKEIS